MNPVSGPSRREGATLVTIRPNRIVELRVVE